MCWAEGNCSETAPGMLRSRGSALEQLFPPSFSNLSLSLLECNERNKTQAIQLEEIKGNCEFPAIPNGQSEHRILLQLGFKSS